MSVSDESLAVIISTVEENERGLEIRVQLRNSPDRALHYIAAVRSLHYDATARRLTVKSLTKGASSFPAQRTCTRQCAT